LLGKYITNDNALFNYYRQIYIWREASKYLETKTYDFVICCRTDIIINGVVPIYKFDKILPNTIYFPNEPRQGAFGNWYEGCPDYLMFGKQEVMMKALNIMDYLYKYKYGNNNIIQSESSMYLFLKGENINIEFLNYIIEIIR